MLLLCLLLLNASWLVQIAESAPNVHVRADGDDVLCSGLVDAPASEAPDCAKQTIAAGLALVDSPGIVFIGAGTYFENLTITKNVTLYGSGVDWTLINGNGADRTVVVNPGINVSIENLSVENGLAALGNGGGIQNMGTLTLEICAVRNNVAHTGGGIANWGTLTINDCDIYGNNATTDLGGGGGVYNTGDLTITDSSIYQNHTDVPINTDGGGIFNGGASGTSMLLQRVSIYENTAYRYGGGIKDQTEGTSTLQNVTIYNNSSQDGTGVSTASSGSMTINNSTIAGNNSSIGTGAGLHVFADLSIGNSIIAGNNGMQCSGQVATYLTSLGSNLSTDSTCLFMSSGDQEEVDPLLGPFEANGGQTRTMALLPGSPAIDAGDNPSCQATDQRGWDRPIDGDLDGTATCDIGAYEGTIDLFLPLIMR
jgi:hypothetical protein